VEAVNLKKALFRGDRDCGAYPGRPRPGQLKAKRRKYMLVVSKQRFFGCSLWQAVAFDGLLPGLLEGLWLGPPVPGSDLHYTLWFWQNLFYCCLSGRQT
jgi:hypothetical protein